MARKRSHMRAIVMIAMLLVTGTMAMAQFPIGEGFGALKEQMKERAFMKAASLLLNNDLPIVLDATTALPTVDTLPGGPFKPRPLTVSADMLSKPLPPGDYVVNVTAFCTEYSVHRPGKGVAYKLAPLKGHAAQAVATLLWRGLKAHVPERRLMSLTWAIQSGLSYSEMPATFKADYDRLIPDYENDFSGDFIQQLEDTYKNASRGTKMPPLDVLLEKMGPAGKLVLSAKRQREALMAQGESDEVKEQTLFAGQESGVYAPVSAEEGPWTERIPGVAYLRYKIEGGNLASNNIMEIRITGEGSPVAKAVRPARLVETSYTAGQGFGSVLTSPSLANLLGAQVNVNGDVTADGMIGYSQGQGAQALIPVTGPGKKMPKILLDGVDVTDGTEQAVVGQKIVLTVDNNGLDVSGTTWQVPGKTVGGYTPTRTSYSSASILPTDFSKSSTTFFWVDQGQARKVQLTYTLSSGEGGSVETTFNVEGPTSPNVKVQMGRTAVGSLINTATKDERIGLYLGGLADNPLFFTGYWGHFFQDGVEIGISFRGSVTDPPDFKGKLFWLQIISFDQSVNGIPNPTNSMELDCCYPYPAVPRTADGTGDYTQDAPAVVPKKGQNEISSSERFSTYLMWTPDQPSAIPVPLGVVEWQWSGTIKYLGNARYQLAQTPPSSATFSPFREDSNYPIWLNVRTGSLRK